MTEPRPDVANPPGLARLHRRATDHDRALRRMRAVLGAQPDASLRALARHATDDPAVALLDAWAVVSDTVAFYSERIAHEGLLRTAAQPESVRELARSVGYQPDPGVAAEVDLAFTVDSGPLVPEVVTVPVGTPAQSVPAKSAFDEPPGPAALPQTFETLTPVEARAVWNALPVYAEKPQRLSGKRPVIRLRGRVEVSPGDPVLVSGSNGRPVLCSAKSARPDPDHPGWTMLTVTGNPYRQPRTVHTFSRRARLFGWNAPDPNLLVTKPWQPPAGIVKGPAAGIWQWAGYDLGTGQLDLDGEFPEITRDSWVVIRQGQYSTARAVTSAALTGKAAFAVSGPVTTVSTEPAFSARSGHFDRRGAVVHCVPVAHDATRAPADLIVPDTVSVPAFTPAFETGRRVLLTWTDNGEPQAVAAAVGSCLPSGGQQVLTLACDSPAPVKTTGLLVRGNVARASHGETARQVLGSGDGATTFQTFRLRRTPLTFVAVGGGEGSRPALTVRVDDVEWRPVADLGDAGPTDRVYTLRLDEDGTPWIGFGDGINGARLPTGVDNVVAVHRVGLGMAGAVAAGRISQLPRRPLGIRDVTNPAAATGASAPEDMAQAREHAPRRVSTLDRAVSLADHERYAAGYPGVGTARADSVWDGRQDRIVVSVRTTDTTDPDGTMLARLRDALTDVRDPLLRLDVLPADPLWFTATIEVRRDPGWPWQRVRDDLHAALYAAYGPWRVPFATPVSATALLSIVEKLPGVLSCRPPLLSQGTVKDAPVLAAQPARWDQRARRAAAAQLLALRRPDDVTVKEVA